MRRHISAIMRAAGLLALVGGVLPSPLRAESEPLRIESEPPTLVTYEQMLRAAEESARRPELLRRANPKIKTVNEYRLDVGPPLVPPEVPAGPHDTEDGVPPLAGTALFDYAYRMDRDFAGPGPGGGPADPMIAVGPDHVVTAINTQVDIFAKDGTNLYSTGQIPFFGLPSNTFIFDMKVIYDEDSDRFYWLSISVKNSDYTSYFHLAASLSSNPLDGWWVWQPLPNTLDNNWIDYPGLGASDRAIYLTGNYVTIGWPFPDIHDQTLWVLDKSRITNGQSLAGYIYNDMQGNDGGDPSTLMPSLTHGIPVGPEGYVCAFQYQTPPDPIYGLVYGVEIPAAFPDVPPVIERKSVDLSNPGIMVNAVQQGGPALIRGDNLGSPPFQVVFRNGRLWTATAYQGGGGTRVRYVEYNVSTWPTVSVASSGFFWASTRYYYWPSITVNAYSDAIMNFCSSGSADFVGARWTVRSRGETAFASSRSLIDGRDYYGSSTDDENDAYRWGDYSGAAVDPTGQGFWIFNMYADTRVADSGIWNTEIGHIPRAVFVDRSYVGPESGTRSQPYNTIAEGHSAGLPGNDLVIRTGTYPEAVTLTRSVLLIADGGTVVIGQ